MDLFNRCVLIFKAKLNKTGSKRLGNSLLAHLFKMKQPEMIGYNFYQYVGLQKNGVGWTNKLLFEYHIFLVISRHH